MGATDGAFRSKVCNYFRVERGVVLYDDTRACDGYLPDISNDDMVYRDEYMVCVRFYGTFSKITFIAVYADEEIRILSLEVLTAIALMEF